MKFSVEECSYRSCPADLGRKLDELTASLSREQAGRSGFDAFCEHLVRILSASFIEKAGLKQIRTLLLAAYDLMKEQTSDVSIELLPFEDADKNLLLIHCPDANFLLDTVQQYLKEQQLDFRILGHPILSLERESGGLRLALVPEQDRSESLILVQSEAVALRLRPAHIEGLRSRLRDALKVDRAKPLMHRRLRELALRGETENLRALLDWLSDGNFWPFSYRAVDFYVEGQSAALSDGPHGLKLPGALGLWEGSCPLEELPESFRQRLLRTPRVLVETIEVTSPILNNERLTRIALRETLESGGRREHIFYGLFSEKAIDEPTLSVPVLRGRIEAALRELDLPEGCHDYRKAVEIFNTFPKVELFFMDPQTLRRTARSFAYLYRSGSVKVVFTRSLSLQGLTLLLIMPREFYSPENQPRIETYLLRFFRAPLAATRIVNITANYLSLHVRLRPQDPEAAFDLARLEKGLTGIVRPWESRVRGMVMHRFGAEEGKEIWDRYDQAFSREYLALIHPRFAVRDLAKLEEMQADGGERFDLWGPFGEKERFFRLQFYSLKESSLNDLMPSLVNMNLSVIDEVDFSVRLKDRNLYIKSFALRNEVESDHDLASHKARIVEALLALRAGRLENDYLNRLIVLTGLSWKEVDVFRGYRNYYFQLGSPFTKKRLAYALIHNPDIAGLLFRYFEAKFSTALSAGSALEREEKYISPLRLELAEALETVKDINEDRILRTLFNLIDSTVRTNYFLRSSAEEYFFSFKISALGIMDMPAPRPMYEIYVHSSDMEGIHLRGGKVARGGIRWSDRPDDFRTEILGLMKTQMTKNALIVPVGSKGGFIVKAPFKTREKGAELSRLAYMTLMRGLLDLTDNRVRGEIVRAEGVVAYDDPDPYLVVAADKGTAHLPDTANSVSAEYGFWLGDSFASGGSSGGYDHKKLGITARGAWESVKRHFRELGIDTQTEPFSVVGIGDMSGDVFGNGMLLSRTLRLLAAFDHRHIFLDPDPDPEASFEERKRLFELPRSSWEDYDGALISKGGGVYPRTSKNIPLSPQVRSWLGTRAGSMDGEGLIQLLLSAPVDLLWNGGIGTYVKASVEKHEDVGDRSNDAVRVDANQLRAKVVGEGGNLGFTQRARIEYALGGGAINTDAVDNSAGVDTSDHEVNLKIFMTQLQEAGQVTSIQARNRLLGEMTEEVCRSVLSNNYSQSQCLSLDLLRSKRETESILELSDKLSHAGLLDRRGEYLPTRKDIQSRLDRAFTKPELAILMSYSKMSLYQALLESGLPDEAFLKELYLGYFQGPVRERFGEFLGKHPLRREITATLITNRIVDQAGCAFIARMGQKCGASAVEAAGTYLIFDLLLEAGSIRQELRRLDNLAASGLQYGCLLKLEDSLRTLCEWTFDLGVEFSLEPQSMDSLRQGLANYMRLVSEACNRTEEISALRDAGASEAFAAKFSCLEAMEAFLPTLMLSEMTGGDFAAALHILHEVRQKLLLEDLADLMRQTPLHDGWDRQALETLLKALAISSFRIARMVLLLPDADFWSEKRKKIKLYRNTLQRIRESSPLNLHPYMILVRILESIHD